MGLPFFVSHRLAARSPVELATPALRDRLGILYEHLSVSVSLRSRRSRVCALHYYAVFAFRRLLFGLLLAFAADWPALQVGGILLSSAAMLAWHLAVRPLAHPTHQALELLNEAVLLATSAVMVALLFPAATASHGMALGWFAVSLMALCVVLNISLVLPPQVRASARSLQQRCRRRCCRKRVTQE